MIRELKPAQPDVLFYDVDSEEFINDSLGTFTLADSTESEMKSEEEGDREKIGYSTDEQQD